MLNQNSEANVLFKRVVFHAILVLSLGLVAGLMLAFSLLDAVNLWPLPVWEVTIPGSNRGWAAAHVGGILNGIMLIVLIQLASKARSFGSAFSAQRLVPNHHRLGQYRILLGWQHRP
jgi:hypothetical protein